jgi:cytoskeletal protein RodZ
MSTVAEQLRTARESQKLTVQKVADTTKIRSDHVRALDEGNFSVFSAPIYIRGSVKNYATMLKLDVPQMMALLDEELKGTERFREPPPFTETKKKPIDHATWLLAKLNWKIGVVLAVILGIILVAALISFILRHHPHSDPLANLPPAVYQPANAGDTLPLKK